MKTKRIIPFISFLCIILCSIFFITRDIIIIINAAIIGFYGFCLLLSTKQALSQNSSKKAGKTGIPQVGDYPEVSILFPLKNEQNVITRSLDKVFEADYPGDKIHVIVIDDHSTDGTAVILEEYKKKNPITLYHNQGKPGKASAINDFLPKLKTDFVVILDADHQMSKNFLKEAVQYFTDPKVGLVQGMNCIRNGNQSIVAKLVELEFIGLHQIIYYTKPMAVYLGSGAMIRTEAFKAAGEFNNDIATEDWELCFRIHQKNYNVIFSNRFCTYELAAVRVREFLKQRYRWLRGTWQAVKIQYANMINSKNMSVPKKIDFILAGFFPFTLVSYFTINVFYALDFLHIISWPINPVWLLCLNLPFMIYYVAASLFARKAHMLLVIPLVPLFYILYSMATFEAMFDEWVINSSFLGEKADRSAVKVKD
ncbi:MAG: glycosyltransferase family 2 protein [Brevinematales bacterium]